VSEDKPPHGMALLWAPWRMAYIRSPKPRGCPFCIPLDDPSEDRERYVLARGKRAYICLNLYPYTNGHILIAPYEHTGGLVEIDTEALAEMGELMRASLEALASYAHPDGYNIGYNIGRAAGAGITDHVHMHVIPRWSGDTSFMCAASATKVIVQALEDTYEELGPLFERMLAGSGA